MDRHFSFGGQRSRPPRILALVLLLFGVTLAVGGVRLVSLGGSFYYVTAGIGLLASGVLLWQANAWGAYVYGLVVLGTAIWALMEVGFDGWALMPRLLPFLVLALFLMRPGLRRALYGRDTQPVLRSPVTIAALIALVAICVGIALHRPYPSTTFPASLVEESAASAPREWSAFGGTAAGTRYAPFEQINTENVDELDVAWTYRTGVDGVFKATPLQIGDMLYVCLARNVVVALDAETGQRRWQFDPEVKDSKIGFSTTCRGVTYYRAPELASECNERILTATTDARLIAVDAATGRRCTSFGVGGEVNLLEGMGAVKPGFYYVTSPPTIARGNAVLGGWVVDNVETQEPSGVIRAFDAMTGRLAWAWDMGQPDAMVLEAGDTYTRGTPNAWSVFSADEDMGLVFVPTGNATPDYYGGHRGAEAEKYASSVVALDAITGTVRWSFQTTHHDLWDYDVPSQPVLADVPAADGQEKPAVIVPTKRGELFVLDRRSGQPLTPVEEKPAPQTDVPNEWTSKTQPFSVGMPSFAGEPLTEESMWGISPIDQMLCRIAFRKLRYDGPLTPPSTGGSLQYPGFAGGMNWGSVALDEANRILIVNSLHLANHVQLFPRDEVTGATSPGMGGGTQFGTPYFAYTALFMSPLSIPCQQPPYGEMAAIDLHSKETLWRRPLGTANELGPFGLKIHLPLPMGVPHTGGSLVTQGGLVFFGGTQDARLRALDVKTGEQLWIDSLPNSGQATPMSYVAPGSGRQFVVMTVPDAAPVDESRGAQPEAEGGGYIIAYALPAR